MSSTIKIARTTLIQIIGKAASVVLGVLTISLILRYLGQTGYGYYTTALAFMTMAATFSDLGLSLIGLREISADPEREQHLFNNILTLRLISSVILLGLAVIVILFFPYAPIVKTAAIILSISFVFNSLIQVLTTLFQKYLQMGKVVLAENLGRLLTLLWTGYVIRYHGDLTALVWGTVIASALFFFILFLFSQKFVRVKLAFDSALWLSLAKKSWPLAITIVLNLIYFKADTIILSIYWPANYVGLYGAPYRVLELLSTFPHMFLGLVMPILTAAWLANQSDFKAGVQKVWDLFLLITLPLIILGTVLAQPLMKTLGGNAFIASTPILRILVWPTAFIFLSTLFNYLVIIMEKQKKLIGWYLIAAVGALITYFIFIPRFNYWAAAIITLLTELFMLVGTIVIYWQTTKSFPNFKNGKNYLAASLIVGSLLLPFMNLQPYLTIFFAPIFYVGVLLLFGWLDHHLIKNIFLKQSQ